MPKPQEEVIKGEEMKESCRDSISTRGTAYNHSRLELVVLLLILLDGSGLACFLARPNCVN
jgi:hypothetical protein